METWLIETAKEQGFAVTILLLALLGRFREWWVDGPTHKKCADRVGALDARVQVFADRTEKRVEELERLLALERGQR